MTPRWAWRDLGATALSTYLPATLMALLAAGTWWLVRQTPMPDAPVAAGAPRHVVDHEMRRFSAHRFAPDGSRRAVLQGDRLRHYLDDDTSLIDAPRVQARDALGRRLNARAQKGWLSSDQSEVRLLGGAQVEREAWTPTDREARPADGPLALSGEALILHPSEQRVRSALPVTVVSPGLRMQAGGMAHDGRTGITELSGGVRGRYDPPPR
jgi:lipopolysaccharide export system protein LptC